MQLRDYQADTVRLIYYAWDRGFTPVAEVPTGGGKSLIQAQICMDLVQKLGVRILCMTHVKELIRQNREEIKELWPDADTGIYSAGLERRETQQQVLFAGVQSIYNTPETSRIPEIFESGPIGAVIIDEAHLVSPNDGTRYQGALAQIRAMNPDVVICGLTATPMRLDQGWLHEGEGAIFDQLVKSPLATMKRLIELGHLSYIHAKPGHAQADLSNVRKRGGEFVEGDLADAFSADDVNETAVNDILHQFKVGRKCCLVFCAGVDNAKAFSDRLNIAGLRSECIIGDTSSAERDQFIELFRMGHLDVLVSVGVLTTGFNVKQVDLLVLLRATNSVSLYIQMIGRATRVHPSKENALILDYGNNVKRLGPVDDPVVTPKGGGSGEGTAPVKECPECEELLHAAVRECPGCGYEFPEPESSLAGTAANAALLKDDEPVRVDRHVKRVFYSVHKKEGKLPSLRVDYDTDMGEVSEWVCVEHEGFARTKAVQWWKARTNGAEPPASVGLALDYIDEVGVLEPVTITVTQQGKWERVVGFVLGDETSQGKKLDKAKREEPVLWMPGQPISDDDPPF